MKKSKINLMINKQDKYQGLPNKKEKPLIDIVMINWNQPYATKLSINSLLLQEKVRVNFFLIDNGSTDNSVEEIKSSFPNIVIIENKINLGFAKAANIGLRKSLESNSDYVFLVNNDIWADPKMLCELIENSYSLRTIISPIIYYYDQPKKIWSKGSNISPITLDLVDSQKSEEKSLKNLDPYYVDFFPACAWLMPKKLIHEIGFFDERFFVYYEDMDYCMRMKKVDLKLLVVPKAILLHKVSISSGGEIHHFERYLMAKNSALYFKKHMNFWHWPIIIFVRFISAFKWSFYLIKIKNFLSLRYYWKGLLSGWVNFEKK